MPRRTTLQYTLATALAGLTLTASTAAAKPVDRVDRFTPAQPAPHQDLRGEEAQDAARAADEEHFQPGQPTWPTHPAPAGKPDVQVASRAPASDGGSDDGWLVAGIALAATSIVGGAVAGASRRYRFRARRAAA